jgi:hypothetical protein
MEMASSMEEAMHDRILDRLTFLAAAMSLGHRLDHLIGGHAVGWPVTDRAHGKPIVMALLCWAGEIDADERAVARFGGLAAPFAGMARPMPCPELDQVPEGGSGPDHEAVRSLFLDAVDLPTAATIVEQLRAATALLAVAQLPVLGGTMDPARADRLGMVAVAEGSRALQAARAGEGSRDGAGTAAAPGAARNLFRREGEYWTIAYEGAVVHLKDAKGLRHLARLLAGPGREFHAVDLEAAEGRPAPAARPGSRAGGGERGLVARRDLGDAGALLDATAKATYRARLTELEEELEEAEGCNDPARAARARLEREFLVQELARAVGLGGRDRRAASHAERARLNATRAIRAAMANLARANPALGRHLVATIRTGRYCSYTPDPRLPVAWER